MLKRLRPHTTATASAPVSAAETEPAGAHLRARGMGRDALWLGLLLLALVWWLSGPGQLGRANAFIQDTSAWLHQRPASADIALVAIDDESIAAIGRWPWRRALHAGLIDHLAQGQPRAIGLDIVLSEDDWDYPGDDLLLARAIARAGQVVLPVIAGTRRADGMTEAMLPTPDLQRAAAALGHTHLPVDTDGVVRSFFVQEGPAPAPWWHMALAMQCVAQSRTCSTAPAQATSDSASRADWQRQQREIIAFASMPPAAATAFTTYSYIDVLRGKIPAAAFRGKYVLIGTTAAGLGERFTAPLGTSTRPVSTVEMLAHVLNGSLLDQHLQPAPSAVNRLLNLAPVVLALLALARLGPSAGLMSCLLLAGASLLVAGLAPRLWHIQTAPAAALLGLALASPLWSWMRLRSAARFLALELHSLQGLGMPGTSVARPLRADLLDQRFEAVEQASRQLRALHHFVSESLLQLPSPTFVCNRQGQLLLANTAAHTYMASTGQALGPHSALPLLLSGLSRTDNSDTHAAGQALLDPDMLTRPLAWSGEGQDGQGRSLMLLAQPFHAPPTTGWLITLVDISDLRQAQSQRDQAMQFISHDIRAPVASIITLLEMHAASARAQPPAADTMPADAAMPLLNRIGAYAQASLTLADDFVHLARAQQPHYRHEPVDLGLLMEQAVNDCWAAAQALQVTLDWTLDEHAAPAQGDPGLLHRALVNLIGNAIKYGRRPDQGPSTVHCQLLQAPGFWQLSICDQGPGMDAAAVQRLSQPFERLNQDGRSDGVGLGLALVRTVAQRHGGSLHIDSTPGKGSCFALRLPKSPSPPSQF